MAAINNILKKVFGKGMIEKDFSEVLASGLINNIFHPSPSVRNKQI
jgi:hypothetical protein